ncbi:S-adenosyl-L-methionine-dependent methyltransferase [Colletotrichum godetiae]|uniref:S-adenosyl-L-methionine-dependent methyltransferase n=1 Tax=Colletotrichum godetiae TaxID=1209918 RepID=A0AAJ0ADI9_9PEZI|nr:S-adenosyl-L-methionine-dependent methyltransferase [Colletotrichum godetiae]KAK1671943.1 S-adenosyl-L-methionine-dependent methyltransferase [Colletotrichum godetiae]
MAENDTASANKAYFNKLAAEYDAKYEKTILQLEKEIRKRKDFIGADWVVDDDDDDDDEDEDNESETAAQAAAASGRSVRLLDYACGTGLISRALAQFTTHCVGIDISENMVAAYNARAENQGLTTDEMHAYQGNLTDPSDPSPAAFASDGGNDGGRFRDFDVAGVGLGFHHFEDPDLSARRLVERLRPGGVFIILDFLPHEKMDHALPAAHTVMHHGFSEERMRSIFEQAGAGGDFRMEELGSGVVFGGHGHGHGHDHGHGHSHREGKEHDHGHGSGQGMKRRVFLARGTKV